MNFNKPPLTIQEQIELLNLRGLIIGNLQETEELLNKINYYRLSGYFLPFEIERHKFIKGTSLENITNLYNFDNNLRIVIQKAISFIEVAVRTQSAHNFALAYGAFGHEEYINFRTSYDKHFEWLEELHKNTEKSREIYINHFRVKYKELFPKIPIWVAVEIMSFGALSKFIDFIHHKYQKKISTYFSLPAPVFISWIKTFCYIRNICAHHSRLWNRELSIAMAIPKNSLWSDVNSRKIASVIFAINKILNLSTDRKNFMLWRKEIEEIIDNHPPVPDFWRQIGLPENWKEHPLWKGEK